MQKFLASFRLWPQRPDWRLYIAFQEYSLPDLERVRDANADLITQAWNVKKRMAPYICRAHMYPQMLKDGVKVFAGCDDDMEFCGERTDFNRMAAAVAEPGTGVVSGNWARNEGLLGRALYKPGKFIQQPLVNMAGGQVSRREVIEIILKNEIKDYLFCDIQVALLAYVHGYVNFRYLGSVLIHRIMEKNGLKSMFKTTAMALPPGAYCSVTPTKKIWYAVGNNWTMPDAGNVTEAAHEAHRTARPALIPAP